MVSYIALVKMTPTGRREITKSLGRGAVVDKRLEKIGVKRTGYAPVIGAFDCLLYFDAPSEVAMGQALMELGRLGAVETNTLTVIPPAEYERMLEEMAEDELDS